MLGCDGPFGNRRSEHAQLKAEMPGSVSAKLAHGCKKQG
jgi:hypothetical protein